MTDVTLQVPEIHCDHCKTSIEGAVADLPGVASANVAIDERTVVVTFDPAVTDMHDIVAAIEDQGYLVPHQ